MALDNNKFEAQKYTSDWYLPERILNIVLKFDKDL